ncbi:unnamed protein product [Brassica napus]|uniref:(rape) hypothetical protein n=1 Tax=Brassica napus TaxID=3708 RepID=A0A816P134_BRANA|nr:unnamed protein product [Brassica napus]
MFRIKPFRRAHPCGLHQAPDPPKRKVDLSNGDFLCFCKTCP